MDQQQEQEKKDAGINNELLRGEEETAGQQLTLLCTGLSIIFLLQAFKIIRSLYNTPGGDFFSLVTLPEAIALIIMPFMIYLLFKRKKAGWTIAAFVFTLGCIVSIENLVLQPGMRIFRSSSAPLYEQLFSLVFTGGILYYLNTKNIRQLFSIDKNWRFYTIAFAPFCVVFFKLCSLVLAAFF